MLNFNEKYYNLHDINALTDTSHYEYVPDRPQVEPEVYLETIKNSKWYGPYKEDNQNVFNFYTANENGDNEYFV